jgi:hypothetical protein
MTSIGSTHRNIMFGLAVGPLVCNPMAGASPRGSPRLSAPEEGLAAPAESSAATKQSGWKLDARPFIEIDGESRSGTASDLEASSGADDAAAEVSIAQAPAPATGPSLERLGHREVQPALKQALKFDTATFPHSGPPKVRRQGSSRFIKALSRGKSLKAVIRTVRAVRPSSRTSRGAAPDSVVNELVGELKRRREQGASASTLRAENQSCKTLLEAGFSWKEIFDAGFEKGRLQAAGFNLTRMGAAGCEELAITGHMLKVAGFSDLLLSRAGFSKERMAKEEAAALAQAKLNSARRRVAELQAQQEELQTRRASVTEEERRRLSLIQDQQRLKEIEQELQREELQREVLRDKSSRKNGTARRLSILGRLAMLTSRRGSTKRDARVTM